MPKVNEILDLKHKFTLNNVELTLSTIEVVQDAFTERLGQIIDLGIKAIPELQNLEKVSPFETAIYQIKPGYPCGMLIFYRKTHQTKEGARIGHFKIMEKIENNLFTIQPTLKVPFAAEFIFEEEK